MEGAPGKEEGERAERGPREREVCQGAACGVPGAGAEEGVENVPRANGFKTTSKRWKRSLKEFAAYTQNNNLKKECRACAQRGCHIGMRL